MAMLSISWPMFSQLLQSNKIRAGVFDGPQIHELIRNQNFNQTMNEVEKRAWLSFKSIIAGFLGNEKSDNYREIVQWLLSAYGALGCNISMKVYFLHWPIHMMAD